MYYYFIFSQVTMGLRGIVKCSSIFVIIFLMCPKRSRLIAPIGKKQEYYHAVRKSLNEVNDAELKFVPAQWSSDVIKQKEGEILMGVDDEPGFDLSDDEIRKFKLWPKGIIPYYIDTLSFSDKVLRDRIRMFLNVITSVTRISFLEMPSPPKDDRTRWVFFVNRRGQLGCADHSIYNFTNDGVQQVILGYDCMTTGGELAEAVLSIAGVPPQHNAPDRDKYINIVPENILPGKQYLFEQLKPDQWLFFDVPYDFSSAGHFHYHRHSVNGRATIEAKPPYTGISMGETNAFTNTDIKKLRMLYNYIVKKKEDQVPECEKLFWKKTGVVILWPTSADTKPRKKPNQYLGLAVDHTHEHKPLHENDKHDVEKEKLSDGDDGDEVSSAAPVTNKLNLKSYPGFKNKFNLGKKNYDPLTYLSDYQTGDEGRRKSK